MPTISDLQKFIGATPDGVWGPKSQALLDEILRPQMQAGFHGKASSFADPADIRAFDQCKTRGGSDQECFKVGDNGIGQWGITQKKVPDLAVLFLVHEWWKSGAVEMLHETNLFV